MKCKLDENIDLRVTSLLRIAGHDVATVQGQGLSSASDVEVIQVCQQEKRCLITADRGFGNRLRFKPTDYSGIVVIRLPFHPSFKDWQAAMATLIEGVEHNSVTGKLWIVQHRKIMEYQSLEEDQNL